MALQKGFSLVKIEMWLVVLPQIIARIHSNNRVVRELIQSLLVRIGKGHPQVCIFPSGSFFYYERVLLEYLTPVQVSFASTLLLYLKYIFHFTVKVAQVVYIQQSR
jgi:hypothetical protein